MNRYFATFCTAILVVGTLTACVGADFQTGSDAYRRGDYVTALENWRPLAEQGNPEAQFMVGLMYRSGEEVPLDYGEAARWMHLSAEQGHASAQAVLGMMYLKGQGVPQDLVRAHAYLSIAAYQGLEDTSDVIAGLEELMTPEDITKARRIASKCAYGNYKGCQF